MKKHGVYLKKGKLYNTKRIYNKGYLMCRYERQPTVDFPYSFLNDINQHYCGGWRIEDIDYSNKALIKRVVDGFKPFASTFILGNFSKGNYTDTWPWGDSQYKELQELEDLAHNLVSAGKYVRPKDYRNIYEFNACFDKSLGELADLEKLARIYLAEGIQIDWKSKKDKHLSEYFFKFDFQDGYCKPWETGLILGYPIENTISIYHGEVYG